MPSQFAIRCAARVGVIALALLLAQLQPCASVARAAAPAASQPAVSTEIPDALKSLKDADAAKRQKVFDLLAEKGDARLIPALKAYKDGALLLADDRLEIYGERINTPDKGSVIPLLDALTGKSIVGGDGQPITLPKPDLSKAIKAPPRAERGAVSELISALSLLDPDPAARTASIRDAAERAARAVPDPADASRYLDALSKCSTILSARLARTPNGSEAAPLRDAVAAMAAATTERPKNAAAPAPSTATVTSVRAALRKAQDASKSIDDPALAPALTEALAATSTYQDRVDQKQKVADDLPKTAAALKRQLQKDPAGPFAAPLKEAIASDDLVVGDSAAQLAAADALGHIATGRAANLLRKMVDASQRAGDAPLHEATQRALSAADRYQTEVRVVQDTFAGLSLGSIYVLIALGLSIIFGLMGVINMAQGEFMMVGAFTTYVVAEAFKRYAPGAYDYYLIAAVPAAFLVSGLIGFAAEYLVIRHLYGRPLDTLLATWGVGLVLVFAARWKFGDNLTIAPPHWMEGGWEVAPDLVFALNRVYIIAYCAISIAIVYFVVNGTKLGLLLRATTQNREMAAALGVATRRVDGFTFAFGAGLAGLGGVAVPLYNKINPNIGQEYIVDCFMVVVVGGVGKLAGAVWAGLGLGFMNKYFEALLGNVPILASGASVIGRVLVLMLIIVFLQWRPQGLFPPKGRVADA